MTLQEWGENTLAEYNSFEVKAFVVSLCALLPNSATQLSEGIRAEIDTLTLEFFRRGEITWKETHAFAQRMAIIIRLDLIQQSLHK